MINKISEPIGEAFTRNHLVISMHQSVRLEVKRMEGGFCPTSKR